MTGDTGLKMLIGLKYAVAHAFIPTMSEKKNILYIVNELIARTKAKDVAQEERAQDKVKKGIAEIKSMLVVNK